MLISSDFVLINFPKTGSSFARKVVAGAYDLRRRRLMNRVKSRLGGRRALYVERRFFNPLRGYRDQHGRVENIPAPDRDKPTVTVVRDPVERFLSLLHFYEEHGDEHFLPMVNAFGRACSPDYPRFAPDAFYRFMKGWYTWRMSIVGAPVGPQTMEFICFFARDPDACFEHIKAQGPACTDALLAFFPRDLRLLTNENLNDSLVDLLLGCGFRESEVAFIRDHERVLPQGIGRDNPDADRAKISPELAATIAGEEQLLYDLYARFGVRYAPPRVGTPTAAAEPVPASR